MTLSANTEPEMSLILASTSIFRQKQLRDMKINFKATPPLFDEDSFKNKQLPLEELCLLLAQKKAESLRETHPGSLIVGSDQMLVFENKMFNKPNNKEEVIERLTSLQGKTHSLITSLFVSTPREGFSHVDKTHLTMKKLSLQQIEEYFKQDQPIGCAGAYKYELNGHKLFEKVVSDDKTSIIGLPTHALLTILRRINA